MKKNRPAKLMIMVIIMIIQILSIPLHAIPAGKEMEKIKGDIDIMENVLDKLIIHESPIWFSGSDRVQGVYLDEFGVLFDFKSVGFFSRKDNIRKEMFKLQKSEYHISDDSDKKKKNKEDIEKKYVSKARAKIEETKELLRTFYLDYASTVRSLSESDRICVNIRLKKDFDFFDAIYEEKIPDQLRVCVNLDNLSDYRKDKISKKKLVEKINFEEIFDNEDDKSIEIMENIFDTVLDTEKSRFSKKGGTQSMYLDGFGALFFSTSSWANPDIS